MNENATRPVKKVKKNKKRLKLGRLVLVLAFFCYIAMFTYSFFGQMVKTYIVDYGKIEDADNVSGFVIRNEHVIYTSNNGEVKPSKTNGERVAKGATVATVYKDSTAEIESKIQEVDQKIQGAMKEQESNKISNLLFSEDIKKLNNDTEQKVIEVCKLSNEKDFTRILELKSEIDKDLQKKADITGKSGPANQFVNTLLMEKKQYTDKLAAYKNNVITNWAGIVSYSTDGLENVLTPEGISKITVKQISDLEQNLNKQSLINPNAIKIVDNYECYIATIVDSRKVTQKAKLGDSVYIRFLESEDDLVPATIDFISSGEAGKRIVTLKINKKVENLLNYRKINLDVVWSTHKGLKIPVSSIVKRGDKEGVLLVNANYTEFRDVERISQDNDYVIIKGSDFNADNSISLYDEIILNGANVEEGRQVRKWDL